MPIPIKPAWVLLLGWLSVSAAAGDTPDGNPIKSQSPSVLHVPRLKRAATLDDFSGMQPETALARSMAKVVGFTQREPQNGKPASQYTEVYVGYTTKSLYVIFLCFDSEPSKVRAHMVRRELIDDDDQAGVVLDTFHDYRHAYLFAANALGIQQDSILTENQGNDFSFDTVWNSKGKLTPQGYMIWMEIPFKSMRFPPQPQQTWGMIFERDIPRNSEASFHPFLSREVQGLLSQEGRMDGLENVAPSHNMQFIPYVSFRAFRTLDDRDPSALRFHGKHADPQAGLDSKIVLHKSLVLDTMLNPDFAQVESDDPEVTVNQRFEVFFPEKRPFFQENASYFQTPINLLFTRRIADPTFGVRLTGKQGPWALGTLLADDCSPSDRVRPADPLSGHFAYFGILRIDREIGKNASIGMIFTDRELGTVRATVCTSDSCIIGRNRVGGFDSSLQLHHQWLFQAQAVTSETRFSDGRRIAGPSYELSLHKSGRLEYSLTYEDTAPGFFTATGFFRRPDIRNISQVVQYRFKQNGSWLQWHGPVFSSTNSWDHAGLRLEWYHNVDYLFRLTHNTYLSPYANIGHTRLRPSDFSGLPANRDYNQYQWGVTFGASWWKQLSFNADLNFGERVNYVPATGPPVPANANFAMGGVTVRPLRGLTIENSYLLTRLQSRITGANILNNHILRSKWNYQFNKEFSLRFIATYNSLLANPSLTSLATTKQFNADVLFSYLVHPGTAIYVGYNSDLQNMDPTLGLDPNGNLLRTRRRFLNDGRTIFVKVSYLLRR